MVLPSIDLGPRKKNPPNRLRAFDSDTYDASLWMYKIMSLASYVDSAFGFDAQ